METAKEYKAFKGSEFYTQVSTKNQAPILRTDSSASDEIERHVLEFLANGGSIKSIPVGVGANDAADSQVYYKTSGDRVQAVKKAAQKATKPVMATSVETGRARAFDSIADAGRNGFKESCIRRAIANKRPHSGHMWKFR